MDIRQILAILPHRFPFLLIDRVEEVVPGRRVVASKCVSINEPQFAGHFPGNPVMPGVLVVEALAQTAALVALTASPVENWASLVLLGLDRVRFRKPVVPGDRMVLSCEKQWERRGIWRFTGLAEVGGVVVAEATITATFQPAPSQAE